MRRAHVTGAQGGEVPPDEPIALARILADQHGAITRRQARSVGLSDSSISRRLAAGSWLRLHSGVFLAGSHDAGLMTRIVAARLWAGDGRTQRGILGGVAAARVWGIDDDARPVPIELFLPRTVRRRQPPGMRLRWTPLPLADITQCRGLPILTPPRLLAELAARLDVPSTLVLADAALRQRRCTAQQLVAMAGSRPRGGRRALLAADERAESPFESRVRAELIEAGLTPPVLQHVIRDAGGCFLGRVDFAWPEYRLVVEADGASVHASAQALRDDVRRQNALVAAGWTVLRFTWADLGRIASRVAAVGVATRAA